MSKLKDSKNYAISIPEGIIRELALEEGMIVEAKVEKGKLVILNKKEKIIHLMQYAGIWENEDVDKIFQEIRQDWNRWQKNLHA